MIISAYFYDSLFSNVPIKQYFLDLQQTAVNIEYDLNGYHVAKFSLPLDAQILQGQKIKIQEQSNNTTQTIFIGYVYELVPVLDRNNSLLQVKCYSEKHYLTRRLVLNSVVVNNIQGIVNNLILDYNSNGDSRTYAIDNINVQATLGFGSTYYDIINNICESNQLDWDVFDGQIRIKTVVGIDRTFGVNFQQISFSPQLSNVSSVEVSTQYNDTNVIVAKNTVLNTTLVYPNPLPSIIRGVEYKEFREYDLSSACANYLSNITNITYRVQIEQDSIIADVGDKVKLRIEGFGDYDNVGSVFVTRKILQYTNGVKIQNIEVSETTLPKRSFENIFRSLQQDVRKLQTG